MSVERGRRDLSIMSDLHLLYSFLLLLKVAYLHVRLSTIQYSLVYVQINKQIVKCNITIHT
jgi:hypothetical protein